MAPQPFRNRLLGFIAMTCTVVTLLGDPLEEPVKDLISLPSLPHLRLHPEKRHLDLDATVCLEKGKLELIACTKNTKEHESIFAIEATPKHVHLMLTLLGARAGHPPRREAVDASGTRWRDVPARGHSIDVSVVYTTPAGALVEKPIQQFLKDDKGQLFQTSTFLFAGSQLKKRENGPAAYLADHTGHFLTLSSFGDEVLCRPQFHSHANAELAWEIHRQDLPKKGGKVILRLKPHPTKKP